MKRTSALTEGNTLVPLGLPLLSRLTACTKALASRRPRMGGLPPAFPACKLS